MENMILIDLETRDFSVKTGGIFEVGALAVSNGKILEKLHLGIVEDESQISRGYGLGYEELSYNQDIIKEFKSFMEKYKFPLVAHNAPFDRRFLTHFEWIPQDYPFYDSIRAIKGENLNLPSYAMEFLMDYTDMSCSQSHTALDDVEVLFKIIGKINPKTWLPIGAKSTRKYSSPLTSLKKDFKVEKNIFNGKKIVFTGKSNYSRNSLIEIAKKAGANLNSDRLSKSTNILVTGYNCGAKLKKAQSMGLKIMTVDEFIDIINTGKEVI